MVTVALINGTHINRSGKRVIEPFDELDSMPASQPAHWQKKAEYLRGTLTASTGTDQGDVGARLDCKVQVAEDTDAGASGVAEVHILEPDSTLNVLRDLSLGRLGINGRPGVEERDDIRGGLVRGRHVRYELEDVAGLHRAEHGALRSEVISITTRRESKGTTHHECDEEVERSELPARDEARAVPEHERHDEEDHRLRRSPQEVAPECSLLRVLKRLVETAGVDFAALLLARQRRDGPDGARSFARELSGVFVRFLVLLVLEDDDTLRAT